MADGKTENLKSINFGSDEGLPPIQSRGDISPAALRSTDGRLWMPMITGLAVVHPERVQSQLVSPPVLIQRVLVDDKPIAMLDEYRLAAADDSGSESISKLILPPDYHHLDFFFTALTFNSPENVRFKYKLDNFEENWTEATEPRKAPYPRLPSGNYQFHVIACNADGIWNLQGATTILTIEPFFWQTWWFRAVVAAACVVIAGLLVRYVLFRRLRRRLVVLEQRAALDRERHRIARDIHDDLGCGLTKIVLLSELSMQANDDLPDDHVAQIATTAKQQIKSLDETVWAINPNNDTLADLIDYVGQFAVRTLGDANIRCQLDLPDDPPELSMPAEVRHNLFMVVKEALNNVLRHSQATEVVLTVSVDDPAMSIIIADNGRGFAEKPAELGQDGLRNMSQRMDDIGGSFALQTAPVPAPRYAFRIHLPRA